MRGCHFQDRPCKPSLCLRGVHAWAAEGLTAPVFGRCDETNADHCPHRGWDHHVHLEVCRLRSAIADSCPTCGMRHRTISDCLACEAAKEVRQAFACDARGKVVRLGGPHLPEHVRARIWRAVRRGVVERDRRRCRACGKDLSRVPSWMTEVHHVVPRCEGGADHPSNLVTLCVMCHKRIPVGPRAQARRKGEEWVPPEVLSAFE